MVFAFAFGFILSALLYLLTIKLLSSYMDGRVPFGFATTCSSSVICVGIEAVNGALPPWFREMVESTERGKAFLVYERVFLSSLIAVVAVSLFLLKAVSSRFFDRALFKPAQFGLFVFFVVLNLLVFFIA
jgi:hypothetical protein